MNLIKLPGGGYLCDPDKNIRCPKTMCYVYGGPCTATLKEEFAREKAEEEKGAKIYE